MTRRVLPVLLLPLALLALSCTDDDDQAVDAGGTAAATATTTTERPPSTESAVTTSPDGSTVTTAAGQGGGSPEEASQRLYDAWVAGDREAAAAVADQSAIDSLFAETPEGEFSLAFCRGSETVADGTECDYTDGAGTTLTFLVEGNGEDGYRVTQLGFVEP